jgi:lipopolysaccharide export system permease protein
MNKPYFSIIDRYVSRELLLTWLAVTLVLMLILMSSTLARLLGKAAEGAMPSDAILPLLGITGLRYFILLLPMSLYLGVLLCFSRLYKDNEMAALGACGVGMRRLYRPLLIIVVPVSVSILWLTLYAMPWVSQQTQLMKSEISNRSEISGLVAGRFNQSRSSNAIMFIERQSDDGRAMNNVFIYQQQQNQQSVETAALATSYTDKNGRKFIVFENGQSYQGQPGQSNYRIIQYEKHGIHVPESELAAMPVTRKEALLTADIWRSEVPAHRAEFQWRLSIPIATLLMAVLALPLSYTTPRKGRYSKLALAILLYLIYSNLLGVGQNWVEFEKAPPWLGMWWVHGFAAMLIVYWWSRRAGGVNAFYAALFLQRYGVAADKK